MSFGWSYPAGVSGTPYDDDPQCEIFCSPRAPSRARIEEQTQAVFDCAPDAPLAQITGWSPPTVRRIAARDGWSFNGLEWVRKEAA